MDRFGISTALLTPFRDDDCVDAALLGAHARSMLDDGADGVTLYGTTGEGASIGRAERRVGIEALLSAGIPAERITLGVCATALADAAGQVAEGVGFGITSFLLLPPFYFKGLSETGLFEWHMDLMARTEAQARFILYHIPQVSGVPLPVPLVGRLAAAAPDRVQAIKDSSGDWDNAEALLRQGAVPVLVGDERLLARAARLGAAGAITGMANLYPQRMKRLFETATEDDALSEEVGRIVAQPVVPALKAVIAARTGNAGWERLRPPLAPLDAAARATLATEGEAVP